MFPFLLESILKQLLHPARSRLYLTLGGPSQYHCVKVFIIMTMIIISIIVIVIRLRIAETRADHAGNFTCSPPHTVADSIRLSVSTGDLMMKDDVSAVMMGSESYAGS